MSDMEGKVTRVGVSKPGGERVSISQLRILTHQKLLILNSHFLIFTSLHWIGSRIGFG